MNQKIIILNIIYKVYLNTAPEPFWNGWFVWLSGSVRDVSEKSKKQKKKQTKTTELYKLSN